MNLARLSVKNPVAVNLLMWLIVIGGGYTWFTLIREFFPNFSADRINVSVLYPGATPEEVEKLVTRRLEQALTGISGIDEISSKVLEGLTILTLKLDKGIDRQRVLNEVKTAYERVKRDLPDDAEEAEIIEFRPKLPVIQVVAYGDVGERRLREITQTVKDDLLAMDQISDVAVSGIRRPEIWVELRPERLEEHGLTLAEVGAVLAASNLDLPGGQLKSSRGNIRVRTLGETGAALDLEQLLIRSGDGGATVRLGQVATVRETFEDTVIRGRYAGKPATTITVFKIPEQDAIDISRRVKAYVQANAVQLGGAVRLESTTDLARFIEQRLDLMIRNARSGLIMVIIALALFLDLRVAFWVTLGIPIAFLGTFVMMQWLGASINLISLFALIVVLGIIVDDAIVIGENVFTRIREGMPPAQAAVVGTTEVGIPVLAAVTTTIVAFLPLMFIEGVIGAFFGVMPVVVIAALSVSLIEAFIILPAHLGHLRARPPAVTRWARLRERVGEFKFSLFERYLVGIVGAFVALAVRWRYVSMAIAITLLILAAGLVVGGVVPFVLVQDVDAESISVELEMAAGTPESRTTAVIALLEQQALTYPETRSVFAVIGTAFTEEGALNPADPATVGQVIIELLPADDREVKGMRSSQAILDALRAASRSLSGVGKLTFTARSGGPTGPDIEVRLTGDELATVERAVVHVRETLAGFDGVGEISDDLSRGKLETRFRLRQTARALGLTTRDLALQLRYALFGLEVQELQRGNDQVKVRVLLPERSRRELADLSRLRIAARAGRPVLAEVADLTIQRGYGALARVDGQRAATITAKVDATRANVNDVTSALVEKLADLDKRFPGVALTFEGKRKETRESVGSLAVGFPVALFLIYTIIAVLFRSYLQPLIVMTAIPFSIVGAIGGHLIMGYPFTILSMIGCVALTGIVVNDSLILVDFINRYRRAGHTTFDAVVTGAKARLRAIILTTITTVAGLGPLMAETSFQARFLIPMAVSIVFGLAFATLITLVLIPVIYMLLSDVRTAVNWWWTGEWQRELPGHAEHLETALGEAGAARRPPPPGMGETPGTA